MQSVTASLGLEANIKFLVNLTCKIPFYGSTLLFGALPEIYVSRLQL